MQNMQAHKEHHGIRGIAMKAAHDTAKIPLVMGQIFNGRVHSGNRRIKNDVQINAAGRDNPIEEETQCP